METRGHVIIFIIFMLILIEGIVVAYSSSNEVRLDLYTDKNIYDKGDYVKIYGYFKANSYVGIEVRGSSGILLYLGYALTDDKGYYERVFRIPENAPSGEYTVYVASPGYFNTTVIIIDSSGSSDGSAARGGDSSITTVVTSFKVVTKTVEPGSLRVRIVMVVIALLIAMLAYYLLVKYKII